MTIPTRSRTPTLIDQLRAHIAWARHPDVPKVNILQDVSFLSALADTLTTQAEQIAQIRAKADVEECADPESCDGVKYQCLRCFTRAILDAADQETK